MIELEIDGRKVAVRQGGTVMDAANELGITIPHFCYHRKLSIAANCRMCLVDIEKSPKPMPACATPAMPGMIVRTASERARQAQRAVMEFLLINHPLDCPICDQGGECQLQDLAVGYGGSASRYQEEKRVVMQKNLGPLVSAQEMARCIHCTRCVRFGQEIAGIMELGMAGHGEHSEILPFVGRTVDSELSGNMIDVCPVGALTSKPFRYRARTWELARRRSISPHDSLGSNLVLQVKQDEVVRVVPLDNEAVNECWLSDRDRFSYEGLASPERLTRPLVRRDGRLQEVSWTEALQFVADALKDVAREHGAGAIGALAAGGATAEELFLLGRLTRALGSEHIDFRLRHSDFSGDGARAGVPWLGLPLTQISTLDRLLLVGSFLRQDQPVLAARIRRAANKDGCRVAVLHATDDSLLMPVAHTIIDAPSAWVARLAQLGVAVARAKSLPVPVPGVEPDASATALAQDLCAGSRVALLAGSAAVQHPQAAQIQAWLQWIAQALGARWGSLGEAANSVGGYLAGAIPGPGGRNARSMLEQPLPAYLLWGIEPELDCANPLQARQALDSARAVIAFSSFRSPWLERAHAVLPIATFAETAGTFVNCEGRVQTFNGAAPPPGEARPGWKVLRVLGNHLGLAGFDYESPEDVRRDALPETPRAALDNNLKLAPSAPAAAARTGVAERLADVPLYFADALVRRAESLQQTAAAAPPSARANAATLARFGVAAGATVRVRQGGAQVRLQCTLDARLPEGVVRIAAGHAASAGLGAQFGPVVLGADGAMNAFQNLMLSLIDAPWWPPVWGVLWILIKIFAIVLPLLGAVAYTTLWERKLIGWMHIRLGPNRVGPLGLLQPIADAVKLIFKEIISPSQADTALFYLAPVVVMAPALAAWAVIPFGPGVVLADINAGLLYVMAITSLGVYGVIVAGWASNSKYAFLGALRASAQMVSYELAMGFVLVCVLMVSGSMNLSVIVNSQNSGWFAERGLTFLSWNWLPLLPLFGIYVISATAETNRHPFDVVEGESEIVAGHMVEYSGMGFAMFFLGEYANMILLSTMAAVMFLGGWGAPVDLGLMANALGYPGVQTPAWWHDSLSNWFWLFAKIFGGLSMYIWMRASFPRYRYDQIMRLGWKIFIPITLAWVVVIAVWMQTPWNIWKIASHPAPSLTTGAAPAAPALPVRVPPSSGQ